MHVVTVAQVLEKIEQGFRSVIFLNKKWHLLQCLAGHSLIELENEVISTLSPI
jgi:hypothetical protein